MKKTIAILLLALLALMPVFSNGQTESAAPAEDGVTEITVSLQSNFLGNEMDKIIAEFERQNPDIKISHVYRVAAKDWNEYFVKIKTMMVSGDCPDVVYCCTEGLPYVIDQNICMPIDEFLANDPEGMEVIKGHHPALQNTFIVDDKVYGSTYEWNGLCTHFNMDLLEKAGLELPGEWWSKEQFLEYAQALTGEVDGHVVYGCAIPSFYMSVNGFLYEFGASFLNEDYTASALDSPEALECFQFLYDLVYKYKVAPNPVNLDVEANFIADQIGMCFFGRWVLPNWDQNEMNYDIQFVPDFTDDHKHMVSGGGGAWLVNTETPHKEAAYRFGKFLAGDWAQINGITNQAIPTSIKVMDEELPKYAPANSMLFRKLADNFVSLESPAEYPALATAFYEYFSAMMSQEMTVEEAVLGMHNAFNEILGAN